MLNDVFKKNMAWSESEQAAVPHGKHGQEEVLVTTDSLGKSQAPVTMDAHMSQQKGANNAKCNLVNCT